MDIDLTTEPLGTDADGKPVYLRDIWPTPAGGPGRHRRRRSRRRCSPSDYADVFAGDERWQSLPTPTGDTFAWDARLHLRAQAPVLRGHGGRSRRRSTDIAGARVLAKLGDSVTTDHISPAGSIKADSPGRPVPGRARRATRKDFNSYGSRRGNHEVMIRGTFANIRLRNQLVPGVEGGFTRQPPRPASRRTIYDAVDGATRPPACRWSSWPARSTAPGSSRDWAAKGTALLGVRAVIAESLRAHPPLEPDRHGRAAAAVPGRRDRRRRSA